jgi:hypothetical protein
VLVVVIHRIYWMQSTFVAWLEDEIDVVLKAVVLNLRDDAIGVGFRRRSC